MSISPIARTVNIHIQGPKVLKFVSLNNTEVLFDIVGLRRPKVRIIDRRPDVRRKMEEILETKKVEELTNLFSRPARMSFLTSKEDSDEIVIQLNKTRSQKPRYMLWIAAGIDGEIPYYDYEKLEVQSFGKKAYALFSLYKRPVRTKKKKYTWRLRSNKIL